MGNDAVLVDAGLDHCRVSLMQRVRGQRPRFAHNFEFPVQDFPSLAQMLDHYRRTIGHEQLPAALGVAFAGPVRGHRTSYSNGIWTFSEAESKKQFGFQQFLAVNDVAALAAALPWLGDKDLSPISRNAAQEEHRIGEGRYAVIFANQGLGLAALTHTPSGYEVIDTEAGHASFAPTTPLERELLLRLTKMFGRVSYERVISAAGLVNLHRALCEIQGQAPSTMTPLEIVLYGRTNADPTCRQTLDVFFSALGAFAGDVALNLCAEGGVYLASDIILETGDDIQKSQFRERFEDKGRFGAFVANIPTFAIGNRSARLVGLSRLVDDALRARDLAGATPAAIAQVLSEAMDAVDQSVLVLSSDLRVVSVTGSAWAETGLDSEILVPGADFAEALAHCEKMGLLGLEQAPDNIAGLIARMKRHETFSVDRRLFGGRISELKATPRQAGGYVIVSCDVTELRRRSKELENLARNLRAASSVAEAASRAKSQFLANMSHEIRTPLNGVLGMAEILGQTQLTADQANMLGTVISSGNLLLTVINDVLDFSKMEAGKMRLSSKPLNLRTVVEEAVAALAPQAEAKGIELVARIEPGMAEHLLGDDIRIRQILNNVVGNAIKFTQQGHVLVDVKSSGADEQDVTVGIAVSDTGCGIPADKLDHVFEVFEQVDGSASRHHDGTGLGLAITRRLLELMGGTIGVESVLEKGTTFRVQFPLARQTGEGQAEVAELVDLTGLEILLVDDKPINRQILEEQTRSWGMVPASVAAGGEALDLLAHSPAGRFAVAILDYQMPGLNGVDLATAIKRQNATKDIPLILLTSVSHLGELDGLTSELFAGVLTKPVRMAQLAKLIRSVARTRASQVVPMPERQTAAANPPKEPKGIRQGAASSAGVPSTSNAQRKGKITILVAEDNPVNRKVIDAMLANGGYDLHFAQDGDEAVQVYRNLLPDIVLMDVSMPKLDGYGATSQIREIESSLGRHAAVIGLTAHAMPEDRQCCLDAGMDDYLAKPIKREVLTQMLGQFGG